MKIKQVFDGIFSNFFWVWNLTFLSIVYLGILPVIGVPLIMATIDGIIPLEFSLMMAATIAVPTVCTVVGPRRFSKQPLQLMRWFYGVEAPLFLLCLLRLFLLRELTPASSLIVEVHGVSVAEEKEESDQNEHSRQIQSGTQEYSGLAAFEKTRR